jgi:hypothetical protein
MTLRLSRPRLSSALTANRRVQANTELFGFLKHGRSAAPIELKISNPGPTRGTALADILQSIPDTRV